MRKLLQVKSAVKPKTTCSGRSRPRLQDSNNNDGHHNDSSSHGNSEDATTTVTFCGNRRTSNVHDLANSRTGQIQRRFVLFIVVLLSLMVTELVLDIAFNDTVGSPMAKPSSSWSWQDYLTAKTAVFRLQQYSLGNAKSNNGRIVEEEIQQKFEDLQHPFRRIAVMGQFNYGGLPPSSILTWRDKMLQYGKFAKIAIRGDFPSPDAMANTMNRNETNVVSVLRSAPYNIDIERSNVTTPPTLQQGTNAEGLFAPYQNLAAYMNRLYQSQKQQQSQPQSKSNRDGNDNEIDGVLYLHDDALPNLPLLRKLFRKTKNQVIIGTDWGKTHHRNIETDGSYQNPRRRKQGSSSGSRRRDDGDDENNDPQKSETTSTTTTTTTTSWERRMEFVSYRIYPFGRSSGNTTTIQNTITYTNAFGNVSYGDTIHSINPTLVSWNVRSKSYCDGGIRTFVKDPDVRRYLEYDGDVKDGVGSGDDLSSLTNNDQLQDYYLTIPSHTQADFLYFPLRYTDIIVDLSRLMARHKIWIECAFPIIVDQISRHTAGQNGGKN